MNKKGLCVSQLSNAVTKYPRVNLKRGKVYFGSEFQRFQSMVALSHDGGKLLPSWLPEIKKRESLRVQGQYTPFKPHPYHPDLLPPTGPMSYKFPSNPNNGIS
jgi:hypothetical protein